jgi:gamma-tubulin complex component 2
LTNVFLSFLLTFWDKKYSLNRSNTPKIFAELGEKILLTGKYLNAIYETGKVVFINDMNSNTVHDFEQIRYVTNCDEENIVGESIKFNDNTKLIIPNAVEILFTTKTEVYKSIVENTYNFSSKVLLNLLLKEHKLMDRLRSLKHYFLLDQSDFMVHFMDISEEEMNKHFKDIKVSRLESLLELSLRITSANSDPYKDDLKVKLFYTDLKSMLMRIQTIQNSDTTMTSQNGILFDLLKNLD